MTYKTINNSAVMTVEDAAVYVGLSPDTLNKYRVYGGGPKYLELGVKAIRYLIDDLDEWLASRRFSNTSEAQSSRKRSRLG